MLSAMAREAGVTALTIDHAPDDERALAERIEQHASADLLVLSGGVSMGRRDLVPSVLARLGARTIFHRARQQPGKPLLFARRGAQLIFGLPGTPLGSHFCFHRYVAAAIRKWLGLEPAPSRHAGVLTAALRAQSDRVLFRLVRVRPSPPGWQIDPLRWLGSSDIIGPALANAYCRFEPGDHQLPAGAELAWEPVGQGLLPAQS
jgi:molybdenum cofactor synthesis domain-containing protein